MSNITSILAISAAVVFDGVQADTSVTVNHRDEEQFTGVLTVSCLGESVNIDWYAYVEENGQVDVMIEHGDYDEGWYQDACSAAVEALFDEVCGEFAVKQAITK